MAVVLLTLAIVLSYVQYYAVDPKVSPQQLYHLTWERARDNIYDQSKLKDWEDWEHKYDHLIKTEEDALKYADELVAHLNESYTGLLRADVVRRDEERADGHYVGIGVEIDESTGARRLSLKRILEGGPAEQAGLQAGDEILSVDGSDTMDWSVERLSEVLKGEEGKAIDLTVRRGSSIAAFKVVRGKVPTPIVATREVPCEPDPVSGDPTKPSRVGYLRIESFDQWSTHKQVESALKKLSHCEALVIDLRDNPGGFIHEAVRTAALFMDHGVVTNLNSRVPGRGYLSTQVEITPSQILLRNSYGVLHNVPVPLFTRPSNLLKGRPVILLVNGNSASAAEMFAAALIENGVATAIGTKTFGKGIGQVYVPVGNGHRLRITNLRATTPNGAFLGDAGQTISNGIKPATQLERIGYGAYGTARDNQYQEAIRQLELKLGKP